MRRAVDLGLIGFRIFPTPTSLDRSRRVDSGRMLGHVPTIRRAETELAGISAELLRHRSDRMHHVVVSWATEVRQTSRHGQSATIVLRDPKLLAPKLDCRRKARIEIDEGKIGRFLVRH